MSSQGDIGRLFQEQAESLAREDREYWESRLESCLSSVRANEDDESARLAASGIHRKLGRIYSSVEILRDGVRNGSSADYRTRLINLLIECNRPDEAADACREARKAFPGQLAFRFQQLLVLPQLYRNDREINYWRGRFERGLEELCQTVVLDTGEQREQAFAALGSDIHTFLAYQARNDLAIQKRYGLFAHRIMAARFPDLAVRVKPRAAASRDRIRIGYVSSRFYDVSVPRFFLGWLTNHDRSRFSVYAWHVGSVSDSVTGDVRRSSDFFHHIAGSVEAAARSIRMAELDVVVFLDIGINPIMTQLAALRLAPVQGMAWDHPVTSGLPTVDFALTSASTEPADFPAHYSERVVALPGLGVCYRKPLIPWLLLRKSRSDFGIREDAVVFLCCQSVSKFLPSHDWVLAAIARRVPGCQFVFTVANEALRDDLNQRLEIGFRESGVDWRTHSVLLPQLTHLDYWNLQRLGDVFLDAIGWSGAGSVFEALACGVPVVCAEGQYMRGRQGMAILRELGLGPCAGSELNQYVEIATELALNSEVRNRVKQGIAEGSRRVFGDCGSVEALEEFLIQDLR